MSIQAAVERLTEKYAKQRRRSVKTADMSEYLNSGMQSLRDMAGSASEGIRNLPETLLPNGAASLLDPSRATVLGALGGGALGGAASLAGGNSMSDSLGRAGRGAILGGVAGLGGATAIGAMGKRDLPPSAEIAAANQLVDENTERGLLGSMFANPATTLGALSMPAAASAGIAADAVDMGDGSLASFARRLNPRQLFSDVAESSSKEKGGELVRAVRTGFAALPDVEKTQLLGQYADLANTSNPVAKARMTHRIARQLGIKISPRVVGVGGGKGQKPVTADDVVGVLEQALAKAKDTRGTGFAGRIGLSSAPNTADYTGRLRDVTSNQTVKDLITKHTGVEDLLDRTYRGFRNMRGGIRMSPKAMALTAPLAIAGGYGLDTLNSLGGDEGGLPPNVSPEDLEAARRLILERIDG